MRSLHRQYRLRSAADAPLRRRQSRPVVQGVRRLNEALLMLAGDRQLSIALSVAFSERSKGVGEGRGYLAGELTKKLAHRRGFAYPVLGR